MFCIFDWCCSKMFADVCCAKFFTASALMSLNSFINLFVCKSNGGTVPYKAIFCRDVPQNLALKKGLIHGHWISPNKTSSNIQCLLWSDICYLLVAYPQIIHLWTSIRHPAIGVPFFLETPNHYGLMLSSSNRLVPMAIDRRRVAGSRAPPVARPSAAGSSAQDPPRRCRRCGRLGDRDGKDPGQL